jgi:hypothetical protein
MTTLPTTDPVEMIPFGPVLLGQTEKTCKRAAATPSPAPASMSSNGLRYAPRRCSTVVDWLLISGQRSLKFVDAGAIVDVLTERARWDGRPTDAGRELIATVLQASERTNGSVWRDLPADDVEAATRVPTGAAPCPGPRRSMTTGAVSAATVPGGEITRAARAGLEFVVGSTPALPHHDAVDPAPEA